MTHPAFARSRALPVRAGRLLRRLAAGGALLAACAFAGCGGDAPPVPDADMVAVLAEMHLLRAREERTGVDVGQARDSLLAARGLDRAVWADAIAWYAARPEAFVGIYGRVVDTLQARQMPVMEAPRAPTPPSP